ncbi:adenylosuccinate synthase [soil metagenome]
MQKPLNKSYWTHAKTLHITDSQWGDTGKGKLVDLASQSASIVVKTNGGANAGHTVQNEFGTFKLHLIPAGFANPKTLCIVGTGCVVDPGEFIKEYEEIKTRVPRPAQFLISDKAHLVMPWHKVLDGLREASRGKGAIGTTGRGIGPTYADRALRKGFRVGDLLNKTFIADFKKELEAQERLITWMKKDYGIESNGRIFDAKELVSAMKKIQVTLSPLIGNSYEAIQKAYEKGEIIVGEAGQGALLDLDLGGYPFVTSSHPGEIGFMISTGLNHTQLDTVLGSTKAYMTRVGNGPMPTELLDKTGEKLREVGHEYGATTGRPRRCGWLDGVATKYGAQITGITELALTKLDVLDSFKTVKICTGYKIGGRTYEKMVDSDPLWMEKATPIYQTFPGWMVETSGIRSFSELPQKAQDYIHGIEKIIELPVKVISVGPERDATFYH